MAEWYYINRHGAEVGPLDIEEALGLAEAGVIAPDTLVREAGEPVWRKATIAGITSPCAQEGASPAEDMSEEEHSERSITREDRPDAERPAEGQNKEAKSGTPEEGPAHTESARAQLREQAERRRAERNKEYQGCIGCLAVIGIIWLVSVLGDGCDAKSRPRSVGQSGPRSLDDMFIAELEKGVAKQVASAAPAPKSPVYDYMESIWDAYETRYGIDGAEARVLIKASEKFSKPLLEIMREYDHASKARLGMKVTLSRAQEDEVNLSRLRQTGFREIGGKWSFRGQEVNVR